MVLLHRASSGNDTARGELARKIGTINTALAEIEEPVRASPSATITVSPGHDPIWFLPDAKTWFARVIAGPGIRQAALTPEIAIDASYLPGELHGEPG